MITDYPSRPVVVYFPCTKWCALPPTGVGAIVQLHPKTIWLRSRHGPILSFCRLWICHLVSYHRTFQDFMASNSNFSWFYKLPSDFPPSQCVCFDMCWSYYLKSTQTDSVLGYNDDCTVTIAVRGNRPQMPVRYSCLRVGSYHTTTVASSSRNHNTCLATLPTAWGHQLMSGWQRPSHTTTRKWPLFFFEISGKHSSR